MADESQRCPRRSELGGEPGIDTWIDHGAFVSRVLGRLLGEVKQHDRTCSYCGGLHPDDFIRRVQEGEEVVPTDKNYKAYVGPDHQKVYFQHFGRNQKVWVVETVNVGGMKFAAPGHFYVNPFFMGPA